jgi:hypothetical protein
MVDRRHKRLVGVVRKSPSRFDYGVGPAQARVKERYRKHRDRLGLALQCEMPGCPLASPGATWNGRPVPLELDHQDGCSWHNRLSNLRFLCANCHAQLGTAKRIRRYGANWHEDMSGNRTVAVDGLEISSAQGTLKAK